MSRTAERQVSFADWELVRQGLRLEPLLQAISDFLDDQKDIIEQVRCDLTRGLKKAATGRSGLTPQQILRSLVLMRIKNWNYRELRERIADGCTLRQFADFYCLPVPRHDAFHRGFNRLTPETLKAINDLVVQAAVELGLSVVGFGTIATDLWAASINASKPFSACWMPFSANSLICAGTSIVNFGSVIFASSVLLFETPSRFGDIVFAVRILEGPGTLRSWQTRVYSITSSARRKLPRAAHAPKDELWMRAPCMVFSGLER